MRRRFGILFTLVRMLNIPFLVCLYALLMTAVTGIFIYVSENNEEAQRHRDSLFFPKPVTIIIPGRDDITNNSNGLQKTSEWNLETVTLLPHPDPGLSEDSAYGILPRIGADGRKPWNSYNRPANPNEKRAKVSFVFTDLGFNKQITELVLGLTPEVDMAFSPYAEGVDQWVDRARQSGHEVLLMLPLEPNGYPANDPGPLTLRIANDSKRNTDLLYKILSKTTGYVGLVNLQGSAFLSSEEHVHELFTHLEKRGLLFVDTRVNFNSVAFTLASQFEVPVLIADQKLYEPRTPDELKSIFADIESSTLNTRANIILVKPIPAVVKEVTRWLDSLSEKDIAIVPLTDQAHVNLSLINQN